MNKTVPKTFSVYLPQTWVADLKKSLEENPPEFKFQIDYFIYIGQLVGYLLERNDKDDLEDGYVPISKSILQRRVYHYRKYLNYLVDNQLIEDDKYYIVGVKSTGIRYPVRYIYQTIKPEIIQKRTLIKSIICFNKERNQEVDDTINRGGTPEYLKKWFSPKLQCDVAKAEEILLQIKGEEELNPLRRKPYRIGSDGKPHRKKVRPTTYPISQLRFNSRLVTAQRISDGSFNNIGLDHTSGRLHSPLTNLSSSLRETITYGGDRLVSIDIVNSQPFFLIALLDPYSFTNNAIGDIIFHYNPSLKAYLETEYPKNYEYGVEDWYGPKFNLTSNVKVMLGCENYTYNVNNSIKQVKYNECKIEGEGMFYDYNNGYMGTIMLVDFIAKRSQSAEVQQYIDWVTNGTFYENFGQEIHPYIDLKRFKTEREAAKKASYSVLFSNTQSKTDLKQIFQKTFPQVFEIIQLVKHGGPTKEFYRTLACTLQSIEAEIILHNCCKVIASEKPDLPIFTIHDSIVTTVGNEEYVKSVMGEVIHGLIGYMPKFSIKYW